MDVMHSGRESTRDSSVLRSWGELWGTGTQWRLVGLKGKGEQCTVLPVAGPKVRSAQRSVPPARMPSSHLLNPDTSRTARGLREELALERHEEGQCCFKGSPQRIPGCNFCCMPFDICTSFITECLNSMNQRTAQSQSPQTENAPTGGERP